MLKICVFSTPNEILNKKIEELFALHQVLPQNDRMSYKNFCEEFTANNRIFFLCVDSVKNKIEGYLSVLNCVDDLEIIGIAVKTKRQKIGTSLIVKLIDYAKENSIRNIFLEVDENNEEAKKFYDKMNFKVTKIRKNYYNNISDAIVMSLKV